MSVSFVGVQWVSKFTWEASKSPIDVDVEQLIPIDEDHAHPVYAFSFSSLQESPSGFVHSPACKGEELAHRHERAGSSSVLDHRIEVTARG